MEWGVDPAVAGGPVNTKAIIVLFTYFLVRENEGAVARRSDISLNTVGRRVLWRLSASKTDPRALGSEREWGCLCSSGGSACPYHAALDHLELLDRLFGSAAADVDFPLFPTADGKFVEEIAMVALVEHIASRAGLPLFTKTGVKRYGKHSWRATGAVHLTAMRVELFRIQLLARWASPVIMRYARLAPLTGLTEHVQELQTTNNVAKIIAKMRNDIGSMKDMFKGWDENTSKLMDIELKVANLTGKIEEYTKDPEFVMNEATKICHRVLHMRGPPVDWVSPCTFQFGRTRHEFVSTPPTSFKRLCHICLPQLRNQRKAEQQMGPSSSC